MRFIAAVVLSSLASLAAAATLEEDIDRYVAIYNGDVAEHRQASQSMAWMGLSDPRLFDVIEKRVREESPTVQGRAGEDRIAWYLRVLGWSGNPKYQPTLSAFAQAPAYSRWAKDALLRLPRFQKWNPIISNRATFDPKLSDDANRVMNMLNSGDVLLQGHGAVKVYGGVRDEPVIERLYEVTKRSLDAELDNDSSNAVAWMLKALGSAHNPKYRPLFEEAAATARDRRVRNNAASVLKNQ